MLRTIYFILLGLSIFQAPLIAQTKRPGVVSLLDLGYQVPIIARGSSPQLSFTLQHFQGVKKDRVKGVIHLNLSPLLDENSSIVISIDGIPIFQEKIGSLGYSPAIPISFPLIESNQQKFTTIQINGSFISDDSIPNANWVYLMPSSEFAFEFDADNLPFFSQFIESGNPEIPIVIKNDKQETISAALRMATFISAKNLPWKLFPSYETEENNKNSYISIGDYEENIALKKEGLFLTPQAVNMIVESPYWPELIKGRSSLSTELHNSSAHAHDPGNTLFLYNLGCPLKLMRGIGDLTAFFLLNMADLGPDCSRLDFTVFLSNSPVMNKYSGYLSFRINGSLLRAIPIKSYAEIETYKFSIPVEVLQNNNTMELTVSYFPDESTSITPQPGPLEASIHPDSFVKIIGGNNTNPLIISDFPSRFVGKGLFMFSTIDRNSMQLGVYLAGTLGKNARKPLDLTAEIGTLNSLPLYDFGIGLLNPKDLDALNPPMRIADKVSLLNPRTNRTYFTISPDHPMAVVETISNTNGPLIVFSDLSIPAYNTQEDFTIPPFTRLSESIAISDDSEWHSIKIGGNLIPFYHNPYPLAKYWNSIKLYVVLFLGIVSIWFIIFVKQTLTKGEDL